MNNREQEIKTKLMDILTNNNLFVQKVYLDYMNGNKPNYRFISGLVEKFISDNTKTEIKSELPPLKSFSGIFIPNIIPEGEDSYTCTVTKNESGYTVTYTLDKK